MRLKLAEYSGHTQHCLDYECGQTTRTNNTIQLIIGICFPFSSYLINCLPKDTPSTVPYILLPSNSVFFLHFFFQFLLPYLYGCCSSVEAAIFRVRLTLFIFCFKVETFISILMLFCVLSACMIFLVVI